MLPGEPLLLVLDPEADRDCERAELVWILDATRDRDPGERIADADLDADETLELLGEAVEVRRPACQDDLADAKGSGLVLVELKRGDELSREGLNLAPDRLSSL